MNTTTRSALALTALAGSVAGIGAGAASAATPTTYVHSVASSTKAGCTSDLKSFTTKAKSTSGVKILTGDAKPVTTPDGCQLTAFGWKSVTYYTASKALSGDVSLASHPEAADMTALIFSHGPYVFDTKADATNHANWTIAQINKNPDKAVYRSTDVHATSDGRWSYEVQYQAASPLFGGDSLWGDA